MPITGRIPFSDVFQESTEGALTPKQAIGVNGVVIGTGVSFQRGIPIGGVDFTPYRESDLAGYNEDGVLFIIGFFPNTPE